MRVCTPHGADSAGNTGKRPNDRRSQRGPGGSYSPCRLRYPQAPSSIPSSSSTNQASCSGALARACSCGRTLGKVGVAGDPPEAFTDPNDVVTAPNGDIYVSESHTNLESNAHAVARISVFDKNGKFLRTFGKLGSGPSEFRTAHAMVFDSRGAR